VLNAIYEEDFLGFSYGFRPGRSQHDALDALYAGLLTKKVNWVLDADIGDFFGTLVHEWMAKFLEHRVADNRVIRLIQKWLKAGILEDGQRLDTEQGAAQGGSISPVLANVYLHYVFDLWVKQWRKKARGEVIVVRYADDIVLGFHYRSEAERFLEELRERFRKFGLTLHSTKTRLIEFGRFAKLNRPKYGLGKPETFDFLGFTHICGETRSGAFTVYRKTSRKRLTAKLHQVKAELQRRRHLRVVKLGAYLRSVVAGHIRYFGVPWNSQAIDRFRRTVGRLWKRHLERRSQRTRVSWERMKRLIDRWLPPARICHPYPIDRFAVTTQGKSRMR